MLMVNMELERKYYERDILTGAYMKKSELKVNAKVQDNRTKEKYKILEVDCFGIAYAKKIGCIKTIAIGCNKDIGVEDCKFFTNRKLKGDFKNGKRKYLFNHV